MEKNIADVLGRGEGLESKMISLLILFIYIYNSENFVRRKIKFSRVFNIIIFISITVYKYFLNPLLIGMSTMSQSLSQESRKYHRDTKHLNLMYLYQQYGIPAIVIFVVIFVVYVRYFWW